VPASESPRLRNLALGRVHQPDAPPGADPCACWRTEGVSGSASARCALCGAALKGRGRDSDRRGGVSLQPGRTKWPWGPPTGGPDSAGDVSTRRYCSAFPWISAGLFSDLHNSQNSHRRNIAGLGCSEQGRRNIAGRPPVARSGSPRFRPSPLGRVGRDRPVLLAPSVPQHCCNFCRAASPMYRRRPRHGMFVSL